LLEAAAIDLQAVLGIITQKKIAMREGEY